MCFLWLDIQTRCPTHVLKPNVNRGLSKSFCPNCLIVQFWNDTRITCRMLQQPSLHIDAFTSHRSKDFKGQHIWLLIPYHFEESTSHWLIWTQRRVNFHSTSCLCVCKCTVGKTQETASLIWKCSHKLYHTTLIHVSNSILFEMLEPGDCCFILHCLSVRTPSGDVFPFAFAWRPASCKKYGNAEREHHYANKPHTAHKYAYNLQPTQAHTLSTYSLELCENKTHCCFPQTASCQSVLVKVHLSYGAEDFAVGNLSVDALFHK